MKSSINYSAAQGQRQTAKIIRFRSLPNDAFPNKLVVRTAQHVSFIDFNNILYCEAQGNYTTIHAVDGKKTIASSCLKQIFVQLGTKDFLRVHQSYVVAKHMLKTLGSQTVVLQNGIDLPLSRRYRKRILGMLSMSKMASDSEV